ncbi:MAG: alpha/beta hydrolase [Lachnospiraceae bacterium]|nr:alpha/beta hydrolase [Lachnospiraceae bacterium]
MFHHVFQIGENAAPFAVYIQEHSESIAVDRRPLVLICPGGGYEYTSDREAEPIALALLAQGFHAAVLRYSCAPAVDPAARTELGQAVALVRGHAEEWHVDPDRIVLWGASAGGHLACHYACTWADELPEITGKSARELAIGGLMLAYPVITSGPFAHQGSFENLLGEKASDEEARRQVSLEFRVNRHVPKTFIWHTWPDDCVPVENSLLLANALKEQGIGLELHIFPEGGHGLSLADERTKSPGGSEIEPCCQPWIDLATAWLKRL